MGSELFRWTAHQIREAVATAETTACAVTESFLQRISAVDDKIGAFVELWEETAQIRAAAIDKRIAAGESLGPLAGVPVILKDNFCTRDGHTECASKVLKGYRSPYNATVVQRILDADAIIIGKANMDEFAMGSSTENSSIGPTRNPWDLECVPGGSSGGAAAAVVADEVAIGFGSDTGGSVRQPAAFCGCLGMKPTYGRVSRYGLVAFASSLDQIGPLTKDARDLALALNVIAGKDPLDATSADRRVPNFLDALNPSVNGLTIGLPKEYYDHDLGDDLRAVLDRAIEALQNAGAKTVEVHLPHTQYAVAAYYIICTAEASANLARFDGVRYGFRDKAARNIEELYALSKTAGFGAEVQRRILLGTYALSSGYYDAYYKKAQQVRTLIRRDFDAAFEKCDILLTPTTPTPAFKIGEKSDDPLEMYLSDIYTTSINLSGVPGLSVPCGMTPSGLPVGMQLVGRPFDEATLINAAFAFEQSGAFVREVAPAA